MNMHQPITTGPIILVLTHGWVVYAPRAEKYPTEYVLHDSSVVRIWGTTAGIGQLAREGKRDGTVLDPNDKITSVERAQVIMALDCKFEL